MNFEVAKVTKIHPESYTVDVLLMSGGMPLGGVPVLSPSASTNTGFNDLPAPTASAFDDPRESGDRDLSCIVGWVDKTPFVVGFFYPRIGQMTFEQPGRSIHRHGSDVYQTIDADGNVEIAHPSGTYIRIGTGAHEDLTGKDFDKKWKIAKNTTKTPDVRVVVANGGAAKITILMASSGALTITSTGDVTVTAPATKVTGNTTLNSTDPLAAGIVTQNSVCAFTGGPHPQGSVTCKAGG